MEAAGDSGDLEGLDVGTFGNMLEDDVEQKLLAALTSSLNDSGGEGDLNVLEELERNFPDEFAALFQQLQNDSNQEESTEHQIPESTEDQLHTPPPTSDVAGSDHTSILPIKNEPSPCVVPSPAAQEIEIVDLVDEDEDETSPLTTENNNDVFRQSNVTIIQSDGGITVCHDGQEGDLRPKKPPTPATPPVQVSAPTPNPVPEKIPTSVVKVVKIEQQNVKVKMDLMDPLRHHHKDKKKDKDKDRDKDKERRKEEREKEKERHKDGREKEKERHKEEREKEKERQKEEREKKKREKQEKEQIQLHMKPPRHPAFAKHRKKFGLVDTSVTLIRLDTIIPVAKHMRLKRRKLTHIEEVDRKKQTQVNNKAGRIRMVPRPRPAFEYEIESNKRKHSDSKSKDDPKRKKVRIFSSSESDEDEPSSKKQKKTNSSSKHKEKSKPHGEFTATGARILPFEKGRGNQIKQEQERIIKRPKMVEPEVKKEVKRDRVINHGSEESAKKLDSILQEAIARQKAQMRQQDQQFRIPKANVPPAPSRQSELDVGRNRDRKATNHEPVSTTTPLQLLREKERRHFDHGRTYAPNSYGHYKQIHNNFPDSGPGGGGVSAIPGRMCIGSEEFKRAEAERLQQSRVLQDKLLMRAEVHNFREDDDGPADMHDDAGSDDDEDVAPDPQTQIQTVQVGPLAKNVCDLLNRRVAVQYPTAIPASPFVLPGSQPPKEPSLAEITVQKCAWWFQGIDKQVSFSAILSEPINPEMDDNAPPSDDGNETVSSFGHVSNPGAEPCQINEITTSSDRNEADVKAEFCGAALIDAQFRISADDKFQKVLDCPRGTNYNRKTFTGTCTICKVLLKSKAELGAHVKSEDHRANFKKISLTIMPYDRSLDRRQSEDLVERVSRNPLVLSPVKPKETVRNGGSRGGSSGSKTSKKEESSKKSKDDGSTSSKKESKEKSKEDGNKISTSTTSSKDKDAGRDKDKGKKEDKVETAGRSSEHRRDRSRSPSSRKRRTRSRSPIELNDLRHRSRRSPHYSRRRSRSRSKSRSPRRRRSSPRRRSTSTEKVAKFLERTRRSRSPSNRKRRSSRSRSRSMSPKVRIRRSRKHPAIFPEKLKLQADGKWLPHHEENWRLMEEEEKALDKEIATLRDVLCEEPEKHPDYEREWQAYWKKTYHEVEMKGLDADSFDYVPGWKEEWANRAKDLVEQMHYDKLGDIRLKYGMDLNSLHRLQFDLPPVVARPPVDAPNMLVQQQQVLDQQPPPPGVDEIYTPFEDDLLPRAMSLSNSSAGGDPAPSGMTSDRLVTIDTVQKTWALLTGQAINPPLPPKSNLSGSSAGNLDLEMELLEVLRLMNSLEDQLSILAPQVEEYFKMAETMELISSRKSYDLLEDKDFVALLFQCRDKFMSLIRANILTREVLKRMNKAVFGLTSLLDSEPCQRLRPKQLNVELEAPTAPAAPPAPLATPAAAPAPPPPPPVLPLEPMPDFDSLRRPERRFDIDYRLNTLATTNIRQFDLNKDGWDILNRIHDVLRDSADRNQRYELAAILAENIAARPVVMSDREFVDYLDSILQPSIQILQARARELEAARRPEETPFRISLEAHSQRELVTGVGTALPRLEELQCRAIPAPVRGHMVQHFQHVRGGRPPHMGMGPRGNHYNGPPQFGPDGAPYIISPPLPSSPRQRSPRPPRASMSPRMRPRSSPGLGDIPSLLSCDLTPPRLTSPINGELTGANASPLGPFRRFPRPSTPVPLMQLELILPPESFKKETENTPPIPADPPEVSCHPYNSNAHPEPETMSKDETESIVSSGSICGSGANVAVDRRVKVKRGSLSSISNESGLSGHRSKLKELNHQSTAAGGAGSIHDDISDVESGELVSSEEDFAPVTTKSVHQSHRDRRRR